MRDLKNGLIMSADKKQTLRPDWSNADEVSILPVNTAWALPFGRDIVLSLGLATLPAGTFEMNSDEVKAYLAEHEVRVQGIVRVMLSPEMVSVLLSLLKRYQQDTDESGRKAL